MLSQRQEQIAAMLARGKTHNEIAHSLGISVHTVRAHLRRACKRNNYGTPIELAVGYAVSKAVRAQEIG